MAPIVFSYWDVRGLAEPIVYLLHHVGADVEIKRRKSSEDSFKEWLKVKYTLGLAFPNLPYIIDADEDVKLTQSLAILRYLGRKYDLAGRDKIEMAQLDLLEQQAHDLEDGLGRMCYDPNVENLKKGYLETLPEKLRLFSEYLQDKEWFVGNRVTYVDFLIYEAMELNRLFSSASFDKYDNLKSYLKRVESLPNLRKYLESDKYKKWPVYTASAYFMNSGDAPE